MVVNLEAAVDSIKKAVEEAELMAGVRAYPGLSNAKRVSFEYVMLKGVNDSAYDGSQTIVSNAINEAGQGLYRTTNRAGGIEGGMSNGEAIVIRVAMKPLATLNRPVLATVDGTDVVFGAGKAGRVVAWDRETRARRWTTPPVLGFTTTLLLPVPLPID